jgi:4-carboxymuconolactone decarboxylase
MIRKFVIIITTMMLTIDQSSAQEADRRFKILQPAEMTESQKDLVKSIQSGPRAKVAGSAANSGGGTVGSPFNVFLRSPELGEHLQQVGSYIRFRSSLGFKLNELAILMVARHWTSQYEWFAHHRLALQAGLDPEIAEAISKSERPKKMGPDEALIYEFTTELLETKQVRDQTFSAVKDRFGEQGVMDLIAVAGYYVLVSMVLNVDRTPVPGNANPPLAPLLTRQATSR